MRLSGYGRRYSVRILRSGSMKRSQVYIDPVYVRGNLIRVYLWWDYRVKIDLRIRFVYHKLVTMDRFRIIGFVAELLRRSGIDLVMTKNDFVNMQFGEFDGLDIKVEKVDF